MRSLIRRSFLLVILLLLLTPVAIIAQSETARQVVDLIFSDDKSSVILRDSIMSTALVSFTHDGKDYQMRVPVTIALDEIIPLTESTHVIDSSARVGVYGIEVVELIETTDEVEIDYDTFIPSDDDHKLVFVSFALTNLSASAKAFYWESDSQVIGIDAHGRRFELQELFGCDDVNPGDTVGCIAIFDLRRNVTLTNLEIHAIDETTVALPDAQDFDEEE